MFRSLFLFLAAVSVCSGTSAESTLASAIASRPELSKLSAALTSTGLASDLAKAGQPLLTVFAPTNAAFETLPPSRYAFLTDPANKPALLRLLQYHVHAGDALESTKLPSTITTLAGSDAVLHGSSTSSPSVHDATCGSASISAADVSASNGMLQVVSAVLVPSGVFCPDMLYVAEQRSEGSISTYGYDCRANGTTVLVKGEEKPVGLTVDATSGRVFWSNDEDYPHGANTSWVTSMWANGTDKKHALDNVIDPQGLTVDSTKQHLYYTEHSGYKVSRSNYDGTDKVVLMERPGQTWFQPSDVKVDAAHGKVFVTAEQSPENLNGTLYMMNMDGSNVTVLKRNLHQNYGLCVDTHAMHVFAVQGGHGGQINCIPYGHTPCKKDPVADILEYPYMCTVDNVWAKYGGPTRVVFTQANIPGQVYSVSTDGTGLEQLPLRSDALAAPMGIELGCSK